MLQAGSSRIDQKAFLEKYQTSHTEGAGLSEEAVIMAFEYLSAMNASFLNESMLDRFIAGDDERFLSLDDKFMESDGAMYCHLVTGMEEPAEGLLMHLFWEELEKEPDTGNINFDDGDLSDEEFEKNQEEVERYRQQHQFRFEKLEEKTRKRFEELSDREILELARRLEIRYRLPNNGDIQSRILPGGTVLHVHGCSLDPVKVDLNALPEPTLEQ